MKRALRHVATVLTVRMSEKRIRRICRMLETKAIEGQKPTRTRRSPFNSGGGAAREFFFFCSNRVCVCVCVCASVLS